MFLLGRIFTREEAMDTGLEGRAIDLDMLYCITEGKACHFFGTGTKTRPWTNCIISCCNQDMCCITSTGHCKFLLSEMRIHEGTYCTYSVGTTETKVFELVKLFHRPLHMHCSLQ